MLQSQQPSSEPSGKGKYWNNRPRISNVHSHYCNKFIQPENPCYKYTQKGMKTEQGRHSEKYANRERQGNLAGRVFDPDDLPQFIPEGQSADILPLSVLTSFPLY
jgi:hypothetical protein